MRVKGFTNYMRTSKTAKLVVLLIAAALSVGLWVLIGYLTNPNPPKSPDILMSLTHQGGLCPDGPCTATTQHIHNDGRYDGNTRLNSQELADLRGIIDKTDFTAYEQNPDPRCNSFTDGRDLVLQFPAKYGDKAFTPCLLDIPKDDGGIRAITKLLDHHIQN